MTREQEIEFWKNHCTMSKDDIFEFIAIDSENETDENRYVAEAGWQEWMNDYTEQPEDKEITDRESERIDQILREGFRKAHTYKNGNQVIGEKEE